MYEVRRIWCAAYHVDKCYLGLRSNQRSESMNARLQMQLDGKMILLEMVEHYETCLSRVRRNEADDDIKALQSEPFTAPDASILEIDAKKRFTPNVFVLVQFSIKAASKCHLIEILDGDDTEEYIVGRKDKGDIMIYVKCEFNVEGNLKGVSCSCRKLQSVGTPCSHIFFVLGHPGERKLPDCCVLERWIMGAKSAFPPNKHSSRCKVTLALERFHKALLVKVFAYYGYK